MPKFNQSLWVTDSEFKLHNFCLCPNCKEFSMYATFQYKVKHLKRGGEYFPVVISRKNVLNLICFKQDRFKRKTIHKPLEDLVIKENYNYNACANFEEKIIHPCSLNLFISSKIVDRLLRTTGKILGNGVSDEAIKSIRYEEVRKFYNRHKSKYINSLKSRQIHP